MVFTKLSQCRTVHCLQGLLKIKASWDITICLYIYFCTISEPQWWISISDLWLSFRYYYITIRLCRPLFQYSFIRSKSVTLTFPCVLSLFYCFALYGNLNEERVLAICDSLLGTSILALHTSTSPFISVFIQ